MNRRGFIVGAFLLVASEAIPRRFWRFLLPDQGQSRPYELILIPPIHDLLPNGYYLLTASEDAALRMARPADVNERLERWTRI